MRLGVKVSPWGCGLFRHPTRGRTYAYGNLPGIQ